MKKILFTILLLAEAICSSAQSFSYTYGGNKLYYSYTDNSHTAVKVVTDRGDAVNGNWNHNNQRPTGNLVVPDTAYYYSNYQYYGVPVTQISPKVFMNCGITSVTLGSNIKSIGNQAFQGCTQIQYVNLSDSLEEIGMQAFYGCYNLHQLLIPDNVTTIGGNAFLNCSIDTLYIGCNVDTIKGNAFAGYYSGGVTNNPLKYLFYNARNCVSELFGSGGAFGGYYPYFTTLIIGDSVQSIPNNAFPYCSNLVEVTIPNNVTTIGQEAFMGCSGITNLTIGTGVITIENSAFQSCSSVSSLFIPDNVTTIGENAFMNCTGISNLTIGTGVTTIGNTAFQGCSSISSLTIPDNVTTIGNSAFYGCVGLTSVSIGGGVTTMGHGAFMNCTNINNLSLGGSVTEIEDSVFFGCSSIGTLNIPNNVNAIGSSAFFNCTGISSITLGNGIVGIGNNSFQGCQNINKLIIPDNVNTIGQAAFMNCSGIDSLYIGKGVTTIGNNAFRGCSNIKYLYYNANNSLTETSVGTDNSPFNITDTLHFSILAIGDSVRSIPDYLFYGCTGIDRLQFGSNIITIGNNAFHNCARINNLVIPDNVTSIGASTFQGCLEVDSIYLGSGIQFIGAGAFTGCTGLRYMYYNAGNYDNALFASGSDAPFANTTTNQFSTLVIGDSVEVLPSNAFINCTSISNLVIPSNVVSIGSNTFNGCSGIDSIYFGSGIHSIGTGAFSGCTGLKYMYYNARNCGNALFASENNAPFANTTTNLFTTLVIGDSVEILPPNAFRNRTSISTLNIGTALTTVSDYAFFGCSGLNTVTLPNNITQIGNYAFYGCSGLNNIVIPNSVVSIGSSAFRGCTDATSLSLGTGLVTIGDHAFYGCSAINNLTIPDAVTSIGNAAFQGCSSIGNLQIGSGITSIADSTFYGCSAINSITIPNGVTSVGAAAFKGCTAANSLSLGTGVASIGAYAFSECDNILTANINAQSVGNNAFANCDRLVSVTLGNAVQTVGTAAFSGDFRLQTAVMGDNITSLGTNAFQGCIRLTRPDLPVNLQTIGSYAFAGCSEIGGKLTFPTGVTNIGDYAFSGVDSVTAIEMKGSNPPTIYAHTFNSVSNNIPVYVPCGAVLNYYTTNYWENFPNIVEAPPFILTVSSNDEVMGTVAITQQPTCSNYTARIQATAQSGYHFLRWNDGNTTNPRQIGMTQDSNFVAIFVVNNSYITVEANNTLWGTVSGTGNYSYNAPVTLTATAYDGYHFLKWNDGNTSNPRYMAAVCDTSFTAIFVSNVSTITVSNANPDWGNVSGSGVYYYLNQVSLTATPVYGYHFLQWNDGNTLNPRTISITQDSTFTAYFAVNTYSIVGTSNSTAMGSVTGGGSYTYLHEMSLTATPAFGYHFVQWNDQNTDNPRTITVTRDSAFTAQFAANSYTITADANDPTMGSAYGSGTYNYNTSATLTAVAEYGYHFTQWSDGVTDNPRTITVQNSATYTAQFEINSYIITVQSSNPAIGTTSGGGSYNYLTPVNITANPNAGYHFTQWSDGNTDNPRLISVTQNATYVAQFAINSYAVGVVSNNTSMGSVSGSGTYNHNTTATLTATAFYGYHFVQWSDGNTDNPRSVVVTDSAQYTAEFTFNSYLVIGNSSNVTLGSVTGGGSYNYLSQVALMAVPVPHYHFTMWNDSIEDNPRTITVTRDTTLTAHFVIDRHTIGVNTADATQGTVSGTDTVNYNTAVWISATANYGYHFTQWNDGNTSNPRRVVVSQDTVFTASFAPNQYTATCAVNDTVMGASVITLPAAPQAGMSTYQGTYLTSLIVTATANYGYNFVQWSDGVTDNPRSFTLTRDTLFTAVFVVNQYMLNVTSNDSTLGTVQGSGSYDYLSQVTITATAAPHSHFVQWNDGNTTNPRLVTLIRDTNFTAIFESDLQYQITVNANDTTMGSVTGSGMYYIGETVTITATANDHYYFSQWSDGNTSNPRVVTVSGEATYTAVFEPVMYTVTLTANDYSMGQVVGGGSYAYGTSVTLEARAFEDYRFVQWSDGDTTAVRTITVTEDIQLEATFERKNPDGIDDVEGMEYKVYVQQRHLVIEGLESHPNAPVMVFDVTGRRHSLSESLSTGVYLVRIGRWTKKVVVL